MPQRAWFPWGWKTNAMTFPTVFTLSCWFFSRLCLAQMTQYQLVSEDICVCSSHGKSAVGTTTLPKTHLCNELITWEFSSKWVTSATSGQKTRGSYMVEYSCPCLWLIPASTYIRFYATCWFCYPLHILVCGVEKDNSHLSGEDRVGSGFTFGGSAHVGSSFTFGRLALW